MNKKKILIAAAIICLIALIAAVVLSTSIKNNKNSASDGASAEESSSPVMENILKDESESQSLENSTETAEDQSSAEEEKNDDSEESSDETTNPSTAASSANNEATSSGKTENEQKQNDDEIVSLPYNVPDTPLTIQKIEGYSGIFLEDGSDQEISNVTAILLKNTGNVNVEYVSLTLNRDGEQLEFEASDIPVGASIVVQEKNQTAYKAGTYSNCQAVSAEIDAFEMSEDMVQVEKTEEGALKVTNLTNEEIPCVRIFYKFYAEDENAYIGGITYTAKLTNLAANDSQTVQPSHYSAGYSRVTMVRTYDSAD